jgi:hypothetical protein
LKETGAETRTAQKPVLMPEPVAEIAAGPFARLPLRQQAEQTAASAVRGFEQQEQQQQQQQKQQPLCLTRPQKFQRRLALSTDCDSPKEQT